jgi:hypothetical protein
MRFSSRTLVGLWKEIFSLHGEVSQLVRWEPGMPNTSSVCLKMDPVQRKTDQRNTKGCFPNGIIWALDPIIPEPGVPLGISVKHYSLYACAGFNWVMSPSDYFKCPGDGIGFAQITGLMTVLGAGLQMPSTFPHNPLCPSNTYSVLGRLQIFHFSHWSLGCLLNWKFWKTFQNVQGGVWELMGRGEETPSAAAGGKTFWLLMTEWVLGGVEGGFAKWACLLGHFFVAWVHILWRAQVTDKGILRGC